MSMSNTDLATHIAKLATATAAYESAWRAEIALPFFDRDARAVTSAAMQDAYRDQVAAQASLAEVVGSDVAHAITGALIQASARTTGIRPAAHAIESNARARSFVLDCISGMAGV